jgi:hypothetical protein
VQEISGNFRKISGGKGVKQGKYIEGKKVLRRGNSQKGQVRAFVL